MAQKTRVSVVASREHRRAIDQGQTPGVGLKSLERSLLSCEPTNSQSVVIFNNGRIGSMLAVISQIRREKIGFESLLIATVSDVRHVPNSHICEVANNLRRKIVDEVLYAKFRGAGIQLPTQSVIRKAQLFCQHTLRILARYLQLCVADRIGVEKKFGELVSIAVRNALGIISEREAIELIILGVQSGDCRREAA